MDRREDQYCKGGSKGKGCDMQKRGQTIIHERIKKTNDSIIRWEDQKHNLVEEKINIMIFTSVWKSGLLCDIKQSVSTENQPQECTFDRHSSLGIATLQHCKSAPQYPVYWVLQLVSNKIKFCWDNKAPQTNQAINLNHNYLAI